MLRLSCMFFQFIDKHNVRIREKTSTSFLLLFVFVITIISTVMPIKVYAQSEPEVVVVFTGEYNGSFTSTDSIIGFDIVASIVKEQQSKSNAVFTLDCGDTLLGNFFSTSNQGEASIDVMNAVHYDAMTLGNHEFDYGYDRLLALAKLANFPFLTQPSVYDENELLSHTVIIERNGIKLGVFGLTTPATTQISNAFEKDFGGPAQLIENAKKATTHLRENGVDIVICLSHIGMTDNLAHDYGSAMDIADNVLGIDVIIDGHTTAESFTANTITPLIYTNNLSSVGLLKFNKKGNAFIVETEILTVEDVKDYQPDEEVTAVINKWQEYADELGKQVIGFNSLRDAVYDKYKVRSEETILGNLIADSIHEKSGCEIVLLNSGNIRTQLEYGDVTWSDINNMLPFSNYILCGDLKGSVIRETLEHGVALRETENSGGFLQVAGLSYTFNPKLPEMSRISEITINGEPLNDENMYNVAIPDFIAQGGDGYTMLRDNFTENTSKGYITDILAEYLKIHGNNLDTKLEGRIVIADGETKEEKTFMTIGIVIAVIIVCILIAAFIILKNKNKTNENEGV